MHPPAPGTPGDPGTPPAPGGPGPGAPGTTPGPVAAPGQVPTAGRTQPPAARPVWALAGIVPAAWLAVFAGTLATGRTLETITRDLGMSSGQGLARVILPYLVAAVLLIPVGYLLGRRAPNAVALPGVVLLVLGVAVTAFAPGATVLTVARVLTGLGAGALVGTAAALVVGVAPATRTVLAVVAGVGAVLAAVFGVVLGGLFTTQLSFRTGFLFGLVLGLGVGLATAAVAIAGLVRRAPRPVAPAPTWPA
ncbi:MFS transporter [Actinocatenispora comari]|uniref:Major facilitator superfamily (MFS) profile domain-containing protein n=1 Tax=Actinocatenispora comari TaxID=2807577 RepID=A0A8J4EIH8_9ACTN|nr:MFS transporter [Actinocatenispora comari]GIL24955.1 hypothetical protein NUM_02100 [Actinocatenispora comari]